jgi:hypothetical protein
MHLNFCEYLLGWLIVIFSLLEPLQIGGVKYSLPPPSEEDAF